MKELCACWFNLDNFTRSRKPQKDTNARYYNKEKKRGEEKLGEVEGVALSDSNTQGHSLSKQPNLTVLSLTSCKLHNNPNQCEQRPRGNHHIG